MSGIWGKYPFVMCYDIRGLDGPSRYMVFDADREFVAEFGGCTVWRESEERDVAENEQSRQRARAFCRWLNTSMKPKDKKKKAETK